MKNQDQKVSKFTINGSDKDVAKKVFDAFENETLKELGDKVVGGVWFEASWGSGTKPKQESQPTIN